ncbi:hypothetical protein D3C85_1569430 [compost metagenome]
MSPKACMLSSAWVNATSVIAASTSRLLKSWLWPTWPLLRASRIFFGVARLVFSPLSSLMPEALLQGDGNNRCSRCRISP